MTNPAVMEQIRKALESVPFRMTLGTEYCEQSFPDYHALAAKVAPLVEALEIIEDFAPGHGDAAELMGRRAGKALATWRTEGST